MEFIFVASIVFALPIILTGLYESDRIIQILKNRYPEEWRESGYPCGYFKVPRSLVGNWWVRDKIIMKLPLWWVKIDWIEKDEEAKKRRKRVTLISLVTFMLGSIAVATWCLEIFPLFQ